MNYTLQQLRTGTGFKRGQLFADVDGHLYRDLAAILDYCNVQRDYEQNKEREESEVDRAAKRLDAWMKF